MRASRITTKKIANPPAITGARLRVRDSQVRRGLSLLELLLAIGLGFVLLTAIYASIDQVIRQTTNGKVEMERLQIARALFRRIELDLRATMFDAASAVSDSETETETESSSSTSEDSSGSSSGSSSEEESTTVVAVTDADDLWTGSLGIRGTADSLWIDLSYVRRQIDFSAGTSLAVSDLKTVIYSLSSVSEADAPLADEEDNDAPFDDDGLGLVRSEGERSILRELNASPGSGVLPGAAEMLAPEINRLTFRYFDGLAWYESWDSASTGALPRAVEVVLGLEPAPSVRGYLANSAVSSSTDTFRMVIAIPVSDPLPSEEP